MPKNSPFAGRKSRFRALKYLLTVTQKVVKLGDTPRSSWLKAPIPEPSLFLLYHSFFRQEITVDVSFMWLPYSPLIPAACSVTFLLNLCIPFISRGLLSSPLGFLSSSPLPWEAAPYHSLRFLPPQTHIWPFSEILLQLIFVPPLLEPSCLLIILSKFYFLSKMMKSTSGQVYDHFTGFYFPQLQ